MEAASLVPSSCCLSTMWIDDVLVVEADGSESIYAHGTKNPFKSNETTGGLSPVIAWGGPVRR
jgi:hypothetical protein